MSFREIMSGFIITGIDGVAGPSYLFSFDVFSSSFRSQPPFGIVVQWTAFDDLGTFFFGPDFLNFVAKTY